MTIPLGISEVPFKTSRTTTEKAYSSLPRFKNRGVHSIYKYASTTRLKSKTSALQYLGQKSSKLSPKPLVQKLVSLGFRRHFWLWQYF